MVHYKSIMGLKTKRKCQITQDPEMYVREILPKKVVFKYIRSIQIFYAKKKKNTTKVSSLLGGAIILSNNAIVLCHETNPQKVYLDFRSNFVSKSSSRIFLGFPLSSTIRPSCIY